jgi:N-alpha-acetyltransferase 15/16, NatA auxiliary subunit
MGLRPLHSDPPQRVEAGPAQSTSAAGVAPPRHAASSSPPLSLAAMSADGGALSASQREGLVTLYGTLAAEFPTSSACRRIPLDFLRGDAFAAAADAYVRKYLTKGVPSLFNDLRPLYW